MVNLRDAVMRERTFGNITFTEDSVRASALDFFIDNFLSSNTFDKVPFRREAEAFAGVYWANRGHYDDAFDKRKL
jgi:hypothetical protein